MSVDQTSASPAERLRTAVNAAVSALRGDATESLEPSLERPPRAEFGDYSTNAAMLLAPMLGEAPRDIAQRLGDALADSLGGGQLLRFEVAGPGFLNVFLSDSWYFAALSSVRTAKGRLGAGSVPAADRQRILVEFVSANPTGPLTAAGGRHAAFGDSLARILEYVGHEVEREYYVNDYGTQVELFGRSIAARMLGEEPPEGGYGGDYVGDLAGQFEGQGVDHADVPRLARLGVEAMLAQVQETLARYRVRMDSYFLESSLHDEGHVTAALDRLQDAKDVYEADGASWLRTSKYGDDKDRVLRRSNGELTYFAADIAYHEDKRERDFDRLVDVWGADHHGYVPRMKAAFAAFGDADKIELIIMQLVHVIERGERARMSKRKGDFVTLDELIDDIGVDAARFFMLQRSHDTTIDLDLDLAREHSEKNPVYYVQYAHARIASILRKAGDKGLERAMASDFDGSEAAALEPAERALIKRMLELPEIVGEAADKRAPHRLTTYAHDLASDFSSFYRDCRVVGAESAEVENLRLVLCDCTRRSLATLLELLGVSAPEEM